MNVLTRLEQQQTAGLFTYSVVVADNDLARSAEQTVAAFSSASQVPVTYCVEPRQNIAMARNKAVKNAKGDFIAFIDDDEFPENDWLRTLLATQQTTGAAGVLGPVKSHFEIDPPQWIKDGRFFERPAYQTGYTLTYWEARSGNVLFRRDILDDIEMPFNPTFDTAGEDIDFFRQMMQREHRFVWCNEAVVYEMVPPSRCTLSYLLKRALLRGANFPKHPNDRVKNVAKSIIAAPCYALALPVLALLGRHLFVRYLIKFLDHTSRLLAFAGLSVVSRRQT